MILVTALCMLIAPLSLTAEAAKARTLVGEEIVIHLHQKASVPLEMESIEMNLDRTQVSVTPLRDGGSPMIFTGRDTMQLHKISGPAAFGSTFHPDAGESWTSDLSLFEYTRPLPAGRYRVGISYRYGKGAADVAKANPVEVEVAPAKLLTAEYRWFGPPTGRTALAMLWTAQNGAKIRWFFQTSTAQDPGAVLSASEFAVTESPAPSAPRLAHLNDIGAMHYDRVAVWLDGIRVCWQPVHAGGLTTNPSCAEHGLNDARLADPPLQRRAGGLGVVLTSGKAAAILDIGVDGKIRKRFAMLSATPERAVVVWDNSANEMASELYWTGSHGLIRTNLTTGSENVIVEGQMDPAGLTVDQWLGTGVVVAAMREGHSLRLVTADLQSHAFERGMIATSGQLVEAVACALLLHDSGRWVIATRSNQSIVSVPGATSGMVRLVSSPNALFLVVHSEMLGFTAIKAAGQ